MLVGCNRTRICESLEKSNEKLLEIAYNLLAPRFKPQSNEGKIDHIHTHTRVLRDKVDY